MAAVEHGPVLAVVDGLRPQVGEAHGHGPAVLVEVVPEPADLLLPVAHGAVGAVVDRLAGGQVDEAGRHRPAPLGVEPVPAAADLQLAGVGFAILINVIPVFSDFDPMVTVVIVIPIVHIHGTADSGDGTRARVLPHVRVARSLADAVVLRAPLAPAVEHGTRQVVLPPARARVDAGLIPRRGNLAVEGARDGRELRRVERNLLILEVEVHGQIGGVPLRLHLVHKVDRVVRLARRVLGIH